MYVRHRVSIFTAFLLSVVIAGILNVGYENLASTAITIVSISVAVYIAAMSSMLGSAYADKLKAVPEPKIYGKSKLGVMTTYFRMAGRFGILTICISVLYQIPSPIEFLPIVKRILSAISCGIFVVNILFVYLIFQFLATSLINSTQLTSRESPK